MTTGLESIVEAVAQLERASDHSFQSHKKEQHHLSHELEACASATESPMSVPPAAPFERASRVVSMESTCKSPDPSSPPLVVTVNPMNKEGFTTVEKDEDESRSPGNSPRAHAEPLGLENRPVLEGLIQSILRMDIHRSICPPPPSSNQVITQILRDDVLCGRGGESNHNPGNVQYRILVKASQQAYLAAKRRDKPRIAEGIVLAVRKLGGRFLRKDLTSNTWRDVGNCRAREKTSQALREGAPELRHSLGGHSSNGGGSNDEMGLAMGAHLSNMPDAITNNAMKRPILLVQSAPPHPGVVMTTMSHVNLIPVVEEPGQKRRRTTDLTMLGSMSNAHQQLPQAPQQHFTLMSPPTNASGPMPLFLHHQPYPGLQATATYGMIPAPAAIQLVTLPAITHHHHVHSAPYPATISGDDEEDSQLSGSSRKGSTTKKQVGGPRIKFLKKRLEDGSLY